MAEKSQIKNEVFIFTSMDTFQNYSFAFFWKIQSYSLISEAKWWIIKVKHLLLEIYENNISLI